MDAIYDLMFYRLNWALAHPWLSLLGFLLTASMFGITAWKNR